MNTNPSTFHSYHTSEKKDIGTFLSFTGTQSGVNHRGDMNTLPILTPNYNFKVDMSQLLFVAAYNYQ